MIMEMDDKKPHKEMTSFWVEADDLKRLDEIVQGFPEQNRSDLIRIAIKDLIKKHNRKQLKST